VILDENLWEKKGESSDSVAINLQKTGDILPIKW